MGSIARRPVTCASARRRGRGTRQHTHCFGDFNRNAPMLSSVPHGKMHISPKETCPARMNKHSFTKAGHAISRYGLQPVIRASLHPLLCFSIEIAEAGWRLLLRSAAPRDAKLLAALLSLPQTRAFVIPFVSHAFSAGRLKGADAVYFLRRQMGWGYVPPAGKGPSAHRWELKRQPKGSPVQGATR